MNEASSIEGSSTPFADRLAEAVRTRRSAVVVGLDPRFDSLPDAMRIHTADGSTTAGIAVRAAAYSRFCREIIDVVAPLVPAVKPQAAFFEELGPAGCAILAEVIQYAQQRGLLVILDGKRNDIGTTAAAYARGWLGSGSAWGADALTVSPYLGHDSLEPFVEIAQARGAGVFVLVKTSNPGGGTLQDLVSGKRAIYQHVASHVERLAAQTVTPSSYGSIGAVVGATYPEQLAELRQAMPHAWILVPGYGTQGGKALDVAAGFDGEGLGALVNSSRGIIFAHAQPPYAARFGQARWQDAVEAATRDMIEQLRAETNAGKL